MNIFGDNINRRWKFRKLRKALKTIKKQREIEQ